MNHDLEDWLQKEGGGFDPWESLGISCGSYSSNQDEHGIAVLELIVTERGIYNTDIARRLALSPAHVELWQYIFCSADLCEYGTSPRGCFPVSDDAAKAFLENWKQYHKLAWMGEPTN